MNPGNSGGPLLSDKKNQVVGVVTSGLANANNINFAAPINEVVLICKRIVTQWQGTPIYDRTPTLNCRFTKLARVLSEHATCKDYEGRRDIAPKIAYPQSIDEACSNINRIYKHSSQAEQLFASLTPDILPEVCSHMFWMRMIDKACVGATSEQKRELLAAIRNNCIHEGDVLVAIDDRPIDLQMMSLFDNIWNDRIGFQSGMDRLCVGDEIRLKYYRPGETKTRESVMKLQPPQHNFRQLFPDADYANYIVMAGVFVMPLSVNHIPLIRGGDALITLVTRPDTKNESVLIVTHTTSIAISVRGQSNCCW